MHTIPKLTSGEEFRWHSGRCSVHRLCTIDEGQGRIRRIEIYISEEALMDAERLPAGGTGKLKTDEMVNLAKQYWGRDILPIVKRKITANAVDADGSLLITSAELEEQRRLAPDFKDRSPRSTRI